MYNGLLFVVHSEIKFLVFIQSDSPIMLTLIFSFNIEIIEILIFRIFKYTQRPF